MKLKTTMPGMTTTKNLPLKRSNKLLATKMSAWNLAVVKRR
jgi:hypothetical protein